MENNLCVARGDWRLRYEAASNERFLAWNQDLTVWRVLPTDNLRGYVLKELSSDGTLVRQVDVPTTMVLPYELIITTEHKTDEYAMLLISHPGVGVTRAAKLIFADLSIVLGQDGLSYYSILSTNGKWSAWCGRSMKVKTELHRCRLDPRTLQVFEHEVFENDSKVSGSESIASMCPEKIDDQGNVWFLQNGHLCCWPAGVDVQRIVVFQLDQNVDQQNGTLLPPRRPEEGHIWIGKTGSTFECFVDGSARKLGEIFDLPDLSLLSRSALRFTCRTCEIGQLSFNHLKMIFAAKRKRGESKLTVVTSEKRGKFSMVSKHFLVWEVPLVTSRDSLCTRCLAYLTYSKTLPDNFSDSLLDEECRLLFSFFSQARERDFLRGFCEAIELGPADFTV